jgi:16S rRNA (guanine527-N7)-methyltransferase
LRRHPAGVSTTTPTSERDQADVEAAIGTIFGDHLPLITRYADLLVTDAIVQGVLGPREAERVWQRHILNSAALVVLIPDGAHVVDLGSGAGLPGIPIAIARPDLTVVLLEPMQRRVRFLRQCLSVLDLPGVRVHHGRAQDGIEPLADYVVARAIAPLDKLVRLSSGLLADNGVLLALKGESAAGELEALQRDSSLDAELVTLPASGQPATVIRVVRPPRRLDPRPPTREKRRSR